MTAWPRGIFVVGTDTGVGKTRVAAAIARAWVGAGYRVGVLKPVSSGGYEQDGSLRSTDADALIAAISTEDSPFPAPPHDRVAPLIYPLPLAPVMAARAAHTPLEPAALVEAVRGAIEWWVTVAEAEVMVVEGVGGLLCPLAEAGWTVADLAVRLDYPLVIVAHRGLGTLNQTLLTAEAARARGLRVAGVILNGSRPTDDPQVEATNAAVLASHLPWTPVLAEWPFQPHDHGPTTPEARDWVDLARFPRMPPDQVLTDPALGTRPGSDDDLVSPSESDVDIAMITDPGRSVLESSSTSDLPRLPQSTEEVDTTPLVSSAEPLASPPFLDLDLTTRPPRPTVVLPLEDAEIAEVNAPSAWKQAVLVSYASAMTLGLIWALYQGRKAERFGPSPIIPALVDDQGGTQGRLGDQSRRVDPLAIIPPDRMVDLRQTLQVGSLRIDPLAVDRRNLILERVNLTGKPEQRDGGKGAVALRVRLQNTSKDQVFAPVDPAFVRNRADGAADTLLELADGRKIYPGTLAVDSEWSQVGESFATLRPGEAREFSFTTEANASTDVERLPGTWRIKLRTGIDTTVEVGIRLPDRTKAR